MIQMVRVDDRLLHGQVAYSWKADLGFNAIVIVSESASQDEIRRNAIKLAKPDGVRLAIRNIDDAIELLKNEKLKPLKVFVVTDTIEAASRVLKGVDEKVDLNIGGIQQEENKKPIVSFAYLSNDDLAILDTLNDEGYTVDFKLVPSEKPVYYKDIKRK